MDTLQRPTAGDPPEPFTGAPGALVLFSDVACPWATVVLLRLRHARADLGLTQTLPIIHLANPLELMHRHALARRVLEAEIPACAAAVPDFGWSLWQSRLDEYPVSSLLALEAVQAARRQSEAAGEELDLALRRAFFVQSRCITMRHEVLAAAAECPHLDPDALAADLDAGTSRAAVSRQFAAAASGAADCSGHLVLPDGTGTCNPGVRTTWIGPALPLGVPVTLEDRPDVYPELLAKAATYRRRVRTAGQGD